MPVNTKEATLCPRPSPFPPPWVSRLPRFCRVRRIPSPQSMAASRCFCRHHAGFCRRLPFAAGQAPGCRAAGCCACHCGHRPAGELLLLVLRSVSRQIKQMHLPRAFYRVELADTGIAVWMYGQQDKPEPTSRHAWDSFYCAYRTDNAVYLYVEKRESLLTERPHGSGVEVFDRHPAQRKAARLQKRLSPKNMHTQKRTADISFSSSFLL